MRVACIVITHLRAKVEMRRQPHLAEKPVVIVDRSQGRPTVADHFPAATGVAAGMTLEQALSLHAGALTIDADEPAYRKAFQQAITALQSISDRVEDAGLGAAYVRLDGLQEMYRGEARLVCALVDALPAYLRPRMGVAGAKFPAFVAALGSSPGGAAQVPPDVAAFLAPNTVDLLPLSPEDRLRMHRFGLHTMGDVAAMHPDAFTAQFGAEGRRAWDLCRGIDDDPVVPLPCEESVTEHTALPFASTSVELLLTAVDTLLRRAYSRPQMRGRYAGRAELACALDRTPPWERPVNFKQAVGNWEQASFLMRRQLEAGLPEAPVEEMTLALSNITGEAGVQSGLFHDVKRDRRERLLEAERQVQTRTNGAQGLYRVVDVAPWHPAPEMRAVQVPIDPAGRDGMKPLAAPVSVAVKEGPDREPTAVRLGRQWHTLGGVEDRWSFDLWWMPQPVRRTYYRVSREGGGQLILFRDQHGACWYQQSA